MPPRPNWVSSGGGVSSMRCSHRLSQNTVPSVKKYCSQPSSSMALGGAAGAAAVGGAAGEIDADCDASSCDPSSLPGMLAG